VSAAYLSGQDGNDVVVKDVPIYTDVITFIDRTTNEVNVYNTIDVITEFLNADVVNYDFVIANKAEDKYAFLYSILQQAVFTDFGLQLVETIFSRQFELTYRRIASTVDGVEVVHSNLGYVLINEDLEQAFPSYSDTKKYPVWLSLVCSPLVRMFAIHDIDTDTITNICATQLYYFYDARIGSIQLLDDKYTANDFTDYTSFITISSEKNADGDYEINGTYTMSKSQDLPTMYYDNDAQEFCWKMNGIETNITAQGVKGDKGDPAGCWFCRGVADTIQENADPMISVRLTTYYTTNEAGDLILRNVNDEACEIKNGDFVCVDVYNSDATNNTTYFDTIFGNVQVGTQVTGDSAVLVYRVVRPYYTSVMSMINNSPITLYEYLKRIDGNGNSDTLHGLCIPSYNNSYTHMINTQTTNNGESLVLHPVDSDNAFGMFNFNSIPTYNMTQKPNIEVDGYNSIDFKKTILYGNVSGNDRVLIGTPIGSIVKLCDNIIPEGWLRIQLDDDASESNKNFGWKTIDLSRVYDSRTENCLIINLMKGNISYKFEFDDSRYMNIFKYIYGYLFDGFQQSSNTIVINDVIDFSNRNTIKLALRWPFSVEIQKNNNDVSKIILHLKNF
jgi:hypothetical protein